jgi:hypothetical protein
MPIVRRLRPQRKSISPRRRLAQGWPLMGWKIAEEVQEHAPQSLSWRDMYIACVLANVANEHTRTCRPGLLSDGQLMQRLRMTDKREILRVIERLVEAKVIERVTRGQKWQQAEFRFLPLGPARPSQDGDPAHPEDFQGGESTHPEDGSGWGVSPLRVGNPPPQGGGNTHPSQGLNEDQSPLLASQRILRNAGLGLSNAEERRFINWANQAIPGGAKGAAWWRKVRDNGDLPDLADRWRQANPASRSRDSPSPEPVPKCSECNADRLVEDEDGTRSPCPTCHPNRKASA